MAANVLFFGILFQNCSNTERERKCSLSGEHRESGLRTEIEKGPGFLLEHQDMEQLSPETQNFKRGGGVQIAWVPPLRLWSAATT